MRLPTELVMNVLELATYKNCNARGILVTCCLAGRDLRVLAQPILFKQHSRIESIEGAQSWLSAQASALTENLEIKLAGPDSMATPDEIMQEARRASQVLGQVFERCTNLQSLTMHLNAVVSPVLLDDPHLAKLKDLVVSAKSWLLPYHQLRSPPLFELSSLAMKGNVSRRLDTAPACAQLRTLDIMLDHIIDDPFEDAAAILGACAASLTSLVLRCKGSLCHGDAFNTLVSHCTCLTNLRICGVICPDCCESFIASLPAALETLGLSSVGYEDTFLILVDTVLKSARMSDEQGATLLPRLKHVVVPSEMKESISEEQYELAKERGVTVCFTKPQLAA